LIVDANVLIDFCVMGRELLTEVHRRIASVHVPAAVVAAVTSISRDEVEALGIVVTDAPLEMLFDAANRAKGHPLAMDDWICLLLAKELAATCVTNDRRLRRECEAHGVDIAWGLSLLLDLVDHGALERERALARVEALHASGTRRVTADVLERFRKRVRG
jgi:predicted nucleic acid-binding protein